MQQHTYTQGARHTHSPARLPLPLGRHPGLLPFGNSAFGTPHHTTPHHTTPHHTTPATRWAGLPVPPGRCARFYAPTGPAGNSDHPLGWTPRPPRPVGPVVHPRRPCRKLRPPPGLDSPSPQAGVPGSTSPRALQDTPTTPWAGLPTAPRQSGSALQELRCPLPPGSGAEHCRSSTAHCPQAVRQCIAGVALPTAPSQ